jgi:hypothetical protein
MLVTRQNAGMRTRRPRLSGTQRLALVVPVAVPVSMWWLFGAPKKRMSAVESTGVVYDGPVVSVAS